MSVDGLGFFCTTVNVNCFQRPGLLTEGERAASTDASASDSASRVGFRFLREFATPYDIIASESAIEKKKFRGGGLIILQSFFISNQSGHSHFRVAPATASHFRVATVSHFIVTTSRRFVVATDLLPFCSCEQ